MRTLSEYMEYMVGSMESWPSYILIGLFTYSSSEPLSCYHLINVIRFMYGNGVPCEMACAGLRLTSQSHVQDKFKKWYSIWSESPKTPHMGYYYNVRLRSEVWINGEFHSQVEPVSPAPILNSCGIESTGIGPTIMAKLRRIRRINYAPPLQPSVPIDVLHMAWQ